MVKNVTAWECPTCGALYLDSWEAEKCCPADYMSAYQCDVCGTIYATRRRALACEAKHDKHRCEACEQPMRIDNSVGGLFCANAGCTAFMRTAIHC
jgi:predicted RNA-binding Zn-ribbon protein involved in translation (DUF1610 family)